MKHQTLTAENLHTFKKVTIGHGKFITHHFTGQSLTLEQIGNAAFSHYINRGDLNPEIIGTKNNNHKYLLTLGDD